MPEIKLISKLIQNNIEVMVSAILSNFVNIPMAIIKHATKFIIFEKLKIELIIVLKIAVKGCPKSMLYTGAKK